MDLFIYILAAFRTGQSISNQVALLFITSANMSTVTNKFKRLIIESTGPTFLFNYPLF